MSDQQISVGSNVESFTMDELRLMVEAVNAYTPDAIEAQRRVDFLLLKVTQHYLQAKAINDVIRGAFGIAPENAEAPAPKGGQR